MTFIGCSTNSDPKLKETQNPNSNSIVYYKNPVITMDKSLLADPTVICYNDTFYLYCTGDNVSYSVYSSIDLVNWVKGDKVFEDKVNVWAPDVFHDTLGKKFYLYYSSNWQVGVAVSDLPYTKFVDKGKLYNNAIDAHLFQDDDRKLYLYSVQKGSQIIVQQMKSPLEKEGDSIVAIEPSEDWEIIGGD